MPKPCRIIIEIPDILNFNWDVAAKLWADHMNHSAYGFAGGSGDDGLTYAWYKVNPETNIPLEVLSPAVRKRCSGIPPGVPTVVDCKSEIADLRIEIDSVRREIYRIKVAKTAIPPVEKENAENHVRWLYNRWSTIDARNAELIAITETANAKPETPEKPRKRKTKVAKITAIRDPEQTVRTLDDLRREALERGMLAIIEPLVASGEYSRLIANRHQFRHERFPDATDEEIVSATEAALTVIAERNTVNHDVPTRTVLIEQMRRGAVDARERRRMQRIENIRGIHRTAAGDA